MLSLNKWFYYQLFNDLSLYFKRFIFSSSYFSRLYTGYTTTTLKERKTHINSVNWIFLLLVNDSDLYTEYILFTGKLIAFYSSSSFASVSFFIHVYYSCLFSFIRLLFYFKSQTKSKKKKRCIANYYFPHSRTNSGNPVIFI